MHEMETSNPVPGLPQGVRLTDPGMRFVANLLEGVLAFVTLGIGWLIWAAMTAGTGQTPAKKILKMRVIKADNLEPANMVTMLLLRGIVAGIVAQFAIILTLGLILLMPFFDKKNQNIWDKISSTYVVNDPDDAWNVAG
jgi:uncharacterized RDD family membrane protein YckC